MRRKFLKTLAATLAAGLAAPVLRAEQAWPTKPITIIVGFSPGGPTDVAARLVAKGLSKVLNVSVIVENRPGADGQASVIALKNELADGYTFLYATSGTLSVSPARYQNLPYDVATDFEYIGAVSGYPSVLVVNAQSPINSVDELVAAAANKKDGLNGGTVSHTQELTLALFKKKYGAPVQGIPYKGDSQSVNDLVGGLLDFIFLSPSVAMPYIDAGKLKGIGVTGEVSGRYEGLLPRIPNLDVSAWNSLVALKGTPRQACLSMADALEKVLQMPDFLASLELTGQTVIPLKNEAFKKFALDETRMWENVAKESGLEKL